MTHDINLGHLATAVEVLRTVGSEQQADAVAKAMELVNKLSPPDGSTGEQ